MPTVYTELLKNKNYDVKKWLKEDCIRQFVVCMDNLSEEEIISKLTELTNYKPQKPEPIKDEDLKQEYEKHIKYYSEKLLESEKNNIGYQKSVKLIRKLWQYPVTEITRNVIDFATRQLILIKDEFNFDINFAKEQLNNMSIL